GARGRLRPVPEGLPRRTLVPRVGAARPSVRDERRLLDVRRVPDDDGEDEHRRRRLPAGTRAEAAGADDDRTAAAAATAADDNRAGPGPCSVGPPACRTPSGHVSSACPCSLPRAPFRTAGSSAPRGSGTFTCTSVTRKRC